jgi:NTP pyrophosphatase (non-canonical NTP hydrolase)
MDADEYQKQAARTLITGPGKSYDDREIMLVWTASGLAGEAGEVIDSVKKMVFHEHGIDIIELQKELGDVLWYVAAICSVVGLHLDDVMGLNIAKLNKRYPNGYSSTDSKARIDTE